jgi:hypothetical protein
MARIAVRRASNMQSTSIVGAVALGLGLGAAIGFLIGELAGPAATRVLRQRLAADQGPRPLVSRLVAEAQAALDDDVILRDCRLRALAVGPGRIELHGWVANRRSRARAAHLVSDAVQAEAIINCLLVRGEDDDAPEADDSDGERSA